MELDRTIKRPALQFFGGQWSRAPWIAQHMPEHTTRVIPFMGGLNEELRLPRAKLTNAVDKDGRIINFFTVLRDRPEELVRSILLTPWHYDEFQLSRRLHEEPLEDARRFWCCCWMSLQGGPNPDSFSFRWNRKRGDRWYSPLMDGINIDHLYQVAERLKYIHFVKGDGLRLVKEHAAVEDALIWCDPPFPKTTRQNTTTGYNHDSSTELHEELAAALYEVKGYALVNGYAWDKNGDKNKLYEGLYEVHGWRRVDKKRTIRSGRTRVQSIWLSPRTWEALRRER